MSAAVVRLDFAATRARVTLLALVLLVLGCAAAAAAGVAYRDVEARKAGLELRLAETVRHRARAPGAAVHALGTSENLGKVVTELGTPWTAVLSDLETASRDSPGAVSVLSIEPDHDKRRVRINGESRDLTVALAYLGRLQASRSLRYPMLDSHEVVADNKDHPVRFALTAEWREQP